MEAILKKELQPSFYAGMIWYFAKLQWKLFSH